MQNIFTYFYKTSLQKKLKNSKFDFQNKSAPKS